MRLLDLGTISAKIVPTYLLPKGTYSSDQGFSWNWPFGACDCYQNFGRRFLESPAEEGGGLSYLHFRPFIQSLESLLGTRSHFFIFSFFSLLFFSLFSRKRCAVSLNYAAVELVKERGCGIRNPIRTSPRKALKPKTYTPPAFRLDRTRRNRFNYG